jgi:hypothetical protein
LASLVAASSSVDPLAAFTENSAYPAPTFTRRMPLVASQWASAPTPLTAGSVWNCAQMGASCSAEAPVKTVTAAEPRPGFRPHAHKASPVPAPRSLTTVADVAPVRLWRSLALTRLQADPVAPPAAGTDGAVVGAEPAVLVEPVAVLVEPVAVLVEPVAVLVEPVAVLEEPHAETIAMQARENAMPA